MFLFYMQLENESILQNENGEIVRSIYQFKRIFYKFKTKGQYKAIVLT